jgi:hypothetical protein
MSELGAIQTQKENDIGGGYVEGEATKYRRKKHSAYLQIIFKRRKIEKLCFWPLR